MIVAQDKKKARQAGRTPRFLFDQLNNEYNFDVDCFAAISNHLLPIYWTRAHDAFARLLNGRSGFCNPPFGIIREALEWGYAQRHESFTCFLLPANIETNWFLDLAVKGDKHCFDTRIAYEPPPGVEYTQPSFASCLVMFGPITKPSDLSFSKLRSGRTGEVIRSCDEITSIGREPRIHEVRPVCRMCNRECEDRFLCESCVRFDDDLPF